jgi:type IV fimbrial biogenesis protein FimT
MKTQISHGFTLWELLITLLVAGIVFGVGVPNFLEFQRNNAIIAASNTLVTAILTARSEAVKRQVPVTLCASPDPLAANPVCSQNGAGSNGGFFVWVDENGNVDPNGVPLINDASDANAVADAGEQIVTRTAAPGGTINVWADSGYITFGPNGVPRRAAGVALNPATRVLVCDERGNRPTSAPTLSSARAVRIEATGRGQVQQEIPDVATALLMITAAGIPAVCPP